MNELAASALPILESKDEQGFRIVPFTESVLLLIHVKISIVVETGIDT